MKNSETTLDIRIQNLYNALEIDCMPPTGQSLEVKELHLKELIEESKKVNAEIRIEEIRESIEAENVSYGEIAELEELAQYIDKGDVLMLQWANVPEFE